MKQHLPQNKQQHPANNHKEKGHVVEAHAFYSGPLPHPQQLRGYEDVTPGTADRIIAMAEKENDHRHKKETAALRGMLFNERLGTICALLIGLAAIGGGVACILSGQPLAGSFLSGLPLATIVVAFIRGRKNNDV